VYKVVASAWQLATCILLYAYSHTAAGCASTNKNFIIAYLTSWPNGIFEYKLRIIWA